MFHVAQLTMLGSQSGANFLFTYYIPIYFQAIHGLSAAQSGIRNMPFIVLSCTAQLQLPSCRVDMRQDHSLVSGGPIC